MKAAVILITTIAAMAAAHGQVEDPGVEDPGVIGRRELLGRALALAPRQGEGAGPYEGPINPPAGGEKKRQNEDGAGPYVGPEPPDGGLKKRQENQTPPGAFGGSVPSAEGSRFKGRQAEQVRGAGPSPVLKDRQGGELPAPVVEARQAESTGTED